mgnify:CR=1 FL=1
MNTPQEFDIERFRFRPPADKEAFVEQVYKGGNNNKQTRDFLKQLFGLEYMSDCILVMLHGLEMHKQRKDFRIDMCTFGDIRDVEGSQMCFGCAATSALGCLLPRPFDSSYLNRMAWVSKVTDRQINDAMIVHLEEFFDALRSGLLWTARMFEIDDGLQQEWCRLPSLTTETWQMLAPLFKAFAEKLQEAGY